MLQLRMLDMQRVAWPLALAKAGSNNPAMMAITTNSSTNVKPRFLDMNPCRFMMPEPGKLDLPRTIYNRMFSRFQRTPYSPDRA